jgi:hypothetical protein
MEDTPQIITIENLLGENQLDIARERILDPLLNWGWFPPGIAMDLRRYDWYQFQHVIYDTDNENSHLLDLTNMILAQALEHSGRRLKTLFKTRIINSHPGPLGNTKPHIDLAGPHQTALWFPLDSQGATLVYQEQSWMQRWEMPEEFTEPKELLPVANTYYEFDGTHWRIDGRPETISHRPCVVWNFIAEPRQNS